MIRYINILLFAGMVFMNYLANALPLNNRTTGEVSDLYPNLFVPAGITFSIWGIIYLLLAAYVALQFTPQLKEVAIAAGPLFALTCLLNSLWIVAWHYDRLWFSLAVMTGLLISLILINGILRDMGNDVAGLLSGGGGDGAGALAGGGAVDSGSGAELTAGGSGDSNSGSGAALTAGGSAGSGVMMLAKAAFGIYLGWISIATIANVTALLVGSGFTGGPVPEQIWAIALIATGAVIVILSIPSFSNPWIGVAVVWAFAGIIIKRSGDYPAIAITALIALLAVAAITVIRFIKG
jgi:hypothetical protein